MKLSLLSIASVSSAASIKPQLSSKPIEDFKDLVAFGDSYTSQAGSGGIPMTFDGGSVWPEFVTRQAHANLHDFAVAGAVCSDRYLPNPLESTRNTELEDQVPKWLGTADATGLPASSTVYSNWIWTNDGGNDGFLAASEAPGQNITSFIECNWEVMDQIYEHGGRYFVVMNAIPLELTPMYAAIGEGGVGNNHYWQNKENADTRRISRTIMEYSLMVNEALHYGIPYNLIVEDRWPGSTVVLYDTYSLFLDMYNDPSAYFASPAISSSSYQNCDANGICTNSTQPADAFLWWDELHPSERADQWVAKSFVDIVKYGNSTYGTYWSSEANR